MRNNLIEPKRRRRCKADYKRWELGQLDIMGRVFLSDGTELKVITGVDDHSRFCVIAISMIAPGNFEISLLTISTRKGAGGAR